MSEKIRRLFEFRIPLISLVLYSAIIFVLFLFREKFDNLNEIHSQVGAIILSAGFVLRVVASLTIKVKNKIKITGVYAICRQPMLLAQLLFVIGLVLVVANIYFFFFATVIFVCCDYFSAKKYDKMQEHYYKDIWKIYKSKTNFLLPSFRRWYDIQKIELSVVELDKSRNIAIFCALYFILVEVAILSSIR